MHEKLHTLKAGNKNSCKHSYMSEEDHSLLPAYKIVTEFKVYIKMFAVHLSIFNIFSDCVCINKTKIAFCQNSSKSTYEA